VLTQKSGYRPVVKNGVRFFLLAVLAVLTLGVAPAVGGADQSQVVVSNGSSGFTIETLDGTPTGSVALAPGTYPGAYAASAGGAIVYDDQNNNDGGSGISGTVWLVRAGQAPLELDSSPDDFDASISYDGSKVTFARYDASTGSSDIYVVKNDGSGLALVASGQGDNYLEAPEFSPEGDSIAYLCGAATKPLGNSLGCGPTAAGTYYQSGIMVMNADGTGTRLIVAANIVGTDGDSLSWSPDGQSIATTGCVTSDVDGSQSCGPPQVFVYRTDGSDLLLDDDPSRQITDGTSIALDPEFASDGSEILFRKIVNNQWVAFGIDVVGTNEHQLGIPPGFEVVPPATGGGPAPVVNVPDPPVSGAGNPVVFRSPLPQCHGFIIEAAGGALADCVPVTTGDLSSSYDAKFTVANDDSIVYDDINQGPDTLNRNLAVGAGPVWMVGPNRTPLEIDSSPYDFDAAISPDGSKVTFARLDPATDGSDLYVVNSNGSGLTRVASGGGDNFLSSPKFSSDLGSIAYLCAPAGMPLGTGLGCGPTAAGTYQESGVILMNADGSNQRMIVSEDAHASDPMYGGAGVDDSLAINTLSWSRDGQWVTLPVCTQLDSEVSNQCDSAQVFAYRTDGSDVFNLVNPSNQVSQEASHPGGAVIPQFCGSSTQILFRAVNDSDTSYLVDRDGTNQQEISLWPNEDPGLAECVPPATGGGAAPTVTVAQPLPFPRGKVVIPNTTSDSPSPIPQCHGFLAETATFAFTSCLKCHLGVNVSDAYDVAADGSIACLDTTTTETDEGPVWLGRPGKAPVELDSSLEDTDPAISPDGSKVAFVRYNSTTQSSALYVMDADGSNLKLLTSGVDAPRVAFPAFSPDGSTIAYLAGGEGVMLVNVDGSHSRPIVLGQENGPLSWSPDAKWLTMVADGQVYTYRTDGSDLYDRLDAKREITRETDEWGPSDPQFNYDGSQILYRRNLDDSGATGNYPYVIDSDGTNRHEVFLSPRPCTVATCDGALNWGIFVPPATGGAVPRAVKPSQATVPNVHALSRHAATRRLAKVRLTGKVTQRRFSSRVARGHVLSQYPRARSQASLKNKRGRTVKLVLSRGRRPAKKRR
jgi:Tol biopolymer transport system component